MEAHSKNHLAKLFEVDRRTIDKYLDPIEPDEMAGTRGKWTVATAAVALSPTLIKESGALDDGDEEKDPEKMQPVDRKHHYEAELKKEQLLALKRETIPITEAREVAATAFKSLSLGLDIIPDRIELECGLAADQIQSMMRIIDEQKANLRLDLLEELK